MSRSTVSLVIAVLGTIAFAYVSGFGGFRHASDPGDAPGAHVVDTGAPGPKRLPAAVNGVRTLYDDGWKVEEGQWWLANGEAYGSEDGAGVTYKKLLESDGTQGVVITTPGMYGIYRTTVQLTDNEPDPPAWCEDGAEASMRIVASNGSLVMGSFESFTDTYAVPPGWYRVRYCTEKQDVAAGQDEFTGEDYTVYAGRHLIQLWQAPRTPDRTLRQESDWARNLAQSD